VRESAVHWNSLKPSAHPPGLRVRSVREQVEGRNTSRRRQSSAHKREQSASRANLCSIFKAANCESTQRAYARRTPHRARISAQFELRSTVEAASHKKSPCTECYELCTEKTSAGFAALINGQENSQQSLTLGLVSSPEFLI
jgi:hypothetical protein